MLRGISSKHGTIGNNNKRYEGLRSKVIDLSRKAREEVSNSPCIGSMGYV
jgi:hypothetical protein